MQHHIASPRLSSYTTYNCILFLLGLAIVAVAGAQVDAANESGRIACRTGATLASSTGDCAGGGDAQPFTATSGLSCARAVRKTMWSSRTASQQQDMELVLAIKA